MTSHPPGRCCTVGVVHEGTSVGEIKEVNGVRTYFSYPKDKKTDKAVLIITDVIGIDLINVQLIADQFAANGYFTVIPDLFNGDPVQMNRSDGFDFPAWLKKHSTDEVDPIVDAAIKDMRENHGAKVIGGVGYCFGGKYVCRFLKKGKLDAGYTAHQSFVTAEELEGIEGPLSIAACQTDTIFTVPLRQQSEEILRKKDVAWQINLFSDVDHGFSVRGDISKPRQKFAKEQAFLQAVHWFDEYLKE